MTILEFTSVSAPRDEARALRIGRDLKRKRIELGLGQADVAALADIARADYELIETGTWPGELVEPQVGSMIASITRALDGRAERDMRVAS